MPKRKKKAKQIGMCTIYRVFRWSICVASKKSIAIGAVDPPSNVKRK